MIATVASAAGRFGIKPKEAERFIKFAVVGTIGFIVDFGTLTFLIEIVGLPTLVANTISFTAAVTSNFCFNRFWTYSDSRSKPIWSQLGQFTLVNLIGLGLNNLLLFLLESPFDVLFNDMGIPILQDRGYLLAKAIATVVVLFWNFFINRYWTYNDVE